MKILNKLLLSDLSKARIFGFISAQVVGIVIIMVSMLFYSDIHKTINNTDTEPDYMIITKKIGTFSGLLSSNTGFTDKEISKLKNSDGVVSVGEFVSSRFAIRASVGISSLGVTYATEMFFEAINDDFIDVKNDAWHYNIGDKEIPIIVPFNYINLYNFGFAASAGLPKLSKEVIKNVNLDISLRDKNGNISNYKGRVVGFSNRINTILAPINFVEWGNSVLAGVDKSSSSRLMLKIDPKKSETLLKMLSKNDYEIENKVFNYEKVDKVIAFIVSITIIIGMVITILSIFLLILSLFLLIQRSRGRIYNLSIIGFSSRLISRPYNKIGFVMTTISFAIAFVLAFVVRYFYVDIMSGKLGIETVDNSSVIIPTLIGCGLYVAVVIINKYMIVREIKSIVK